MMLSAIKRPFCGVLDVFFGSERQLLVCLAGFSVGTCCHSGTFLKPLGKVVGTFESTLIGYFSNGVATSGQAFECFLVADIHQVFQDGCSGDFFEAGGECGARHVHLGEQGIDVHAGIVPVFMEVLTGLPYGFVNDQLFDVVFDVHDEGAGCGALNGVCFWIADVGCEHFQPLQGQQAIGKNAWPDRGPLQQSGMFGSVQQDIIQFGAVFFCHGFEGFAGICNLHLVCFGDLLPSCSAQGYSSGDHPGNRHKRAAHPWKDGACGRSDMSHIKDTEIYTEGRQDAGTCTKKGVVFVVVFGCKFVFVHLHGYSYIKQVVRSIKKGNFIQKHSFRLVQILFGVHYYDAYLTMVEERFV